MRGNKAPRIRLQNTVNAQGSIYRQSLEGSVDCFWRVPCTGNVAVRQREIFYSSERVELSIGSSSRRIALLHFGFLPMHLDSVVAEAQASYHKVPVLVLTALHSVSQATNASMYLEHERWKGDHVRSEKSVTEKSFHL